MARESISQPELLHAATRYSGSLSDALARLVGAYPDDHQFELHAPQSAPELREVYQFRVDSLAKSGLSFPGADDVVNDLTGRTSVQFVSEPLRIDGRVAAVVVDDAGVVSAWCTPSPEDHAAAKTASARRGAPVRRFRRA